MYYNLTPITNLLKEDIPNADVWKQKLHSFFSNEEYDGELQDQYYDTLVSDTHQIWHLLHDGYYVDQYTGFFTFTAPVVDTKHSFNMAHFLSKNFQHFYKKRILTISADFGIMNIQLKMSGLNLISSIQKPLYHVGSVLACIGNNCPIYPINKLDFEEEDAIIMSCVFEEEELSWKNWQYMLDKRLDGKEVFFTSNTFTNLKNYVDYSKLELVFDPSKAYDSEDYADLKYGYANRIYRLI